MGWIALWGTWQEGTCHHRARPWSTQVLIEWSEVGGANSGENLRRGSRENPDWADGADQWLDAMQPEGFQQTDGPTCLLSLETWSH